jgi:hypothetical protein
MPYRLIAIDARVKRLTRWLERPGMKSDRDDALDVMNQ